MNSLRELLIASNLLEKGLPAQLSGRKTTAVAFGSYKRLAERKAIISKERATGARNASGAYAAE
jgi:hypothetical protein